jgi:hypothetical protein
MKVNWRSSGRIRMMTIDQTVYLAASLFLLCMVLLILLGRRRILEARKLPYFMLRRARVVQGWRVILLGIALGVVSVFTFTLGRRAVYVIYPPTPSITPTRTQTPTSTITLIPSITPTASITPIPSVTPTTTITPTPQLPEEIRILIRETITPNPEALFSPIQVAVRIDSINRSTLRRISSHLKDVSLEPLVITTYRMGCAGQRSGTTTIKSYASKRKRGMGVQEVMGTRSVNPKSGYQAGMISSYSLQINGRVRPTLRCSN